MGQYEYSGWVVIQPGFLRCEQLFPGDGPSFSGN